jgi:hypothetical protein
MIPDGRVARIGAESAQTGAEFFDSVNARGRRERLPALGGGFFLVGCADRRQVPA